MAWNKVYYNLSPANLTPQIWRLKGYIKSVHTQNTGK